MKCEHLRAQSVQSFDNTKAGGYFIQNTLIMRKRKHRNQSQVVVPMSLRAFILRRYHGLPISGHVGIKKTLAHMRMAYHWPNMKTDAAKWIRSCLTCAKRKRCRNMHATEPGNVCNISEPWHTLAMDVVSPKITSKEGYTTILTVIDMFSRWVIAIPLRQANAVEVSEAL